MFAAGGLGFELCMFVAAGLEAVAVRSERSFIIITHSEGPRFQDPIMLSNHVFFVNMSNEFVCVCQYE